MEAVLQSTISALGCLDGGIYYPEPDCFESIRDLIRFLRYDNSTALARRLCGDHNIVQNDLVPIMKADSTSSNLFDIALRLAINLTQPTAIAFGGKTPEDKETWSAYLKVEENLKRSKMSFADEYFFGILKDKLCSFFEKDWSERNEETKMIIERIFVLIRNAFAIPSVSMDEQRTTWSMNCQDRVVLALLKSGLGNYIINIVESETDFRLLIMEIIAHVIKKREPRDIAFADCSRSLEEKARDEEELKKSVDVSLRKQIESRRNLSIRHSRFAGSYVVKGLKAVNQQNDVIVQKPLKDVTRLNFIDQRKVGKRKAKNRRPFDYNEKMHISTLEVRGELKKFCVSALQKAYNIIMRQCKDAAFGGRRTLVYKSADVHYFLLEWFFMEFRRMSALPIEQVESTIGKEAFHHVQTQLDSYLESAQIDRKEGRVFGLRAQYAVLAYRELLSTLLGMIESGNIDEKELAQATCVHIMQMEEYRDLSTSIIRRFAPGTFSKTFLRNLVIANHIYMRLLEKCVKAGRLSKVKKKRKVRRRKKKNNVETVVQEEEKEELNLDHVWEEICEELSDVLLGYIEATDDINPIDVMLRVDDSVHEQFAVLMIQRALRERRIADAVGIYRSARMLWPTDGVFGTQGISAEDEFLDLRAIFFSSLLEVEKEWTVAYQAAYGSEEKQLGENIFDNEVEDLEDVSSGEGEEDDERYEIKEIDFDFEGYVQKFARKDVLKWYVFLLAEYESNSVELNKAILKMFHRIAFDLNSSSRLFQVSLFRIFSQVGAYFRKMPLSDIKQSPYYEIYEFGHHLLRRFFKAYERLGWKLIPEMLFWKGAKECYEIDFGYGSYMGKEKSNKEKELLWTEELDNELRTLHDEYVSYEDKPEESERVISPGIDVVEFVEHNLSKPRTRKQILREMKSLGLNTFGAKTKLGVTLRQPHSANLPVEIMEQIKGLVAAYNELPFIERNCDLVEFIRNRLPEEFSRPRLIKHLRYEGIEYRTTKKRNTKLWPDELITELRSIYQQYKELKHTSGDLVKYAAARLSVKKSRREISTKLKEIGAIDIKRPISGAQKKVVVDAFAAQDSDSYGDEESEEGEDADNKKSLFTRMARKLSEEFIDEYGREENSISVSIQTYSVSESRLSSSFDDSDSTGGDEELEETGDPAKSHSQTSVIESLTPPANDSNRVKKTSETLNSPSFGSDSESEDEIVIRKKRIAQSQNQDDLQDVLIAPVHKRRIVLSDSDDN